MYVLIFGHDPYRGVVFTSYTVLARSRDLNEIARIRGVSGDLVFNESTKEIVQDDTWLFSWERESPKCYARRHMDRKAVIA